MTSSTEFQLSGDLAAAQTVVMNALTAAGFTAQAATPGWTKISRGNPTKTALLGGLAGKDFHVSFLLAFGATPEGAPLVKLDRDLAMGALKGGAIGASKTATAYTQTLDVIGNAATQAGIFVATRPLN